MPVPQMASRGWRATVWAELSGSEGTPCQPGGTDTLPCCHPFYHVHTIDANFDFVLKLPL
jgi:hypothetical protein